MKASAGIEERNVAPLGFDDVRRGFDFGRLTLDAACPIAMLDGRDLALVAVQRGSVVVDAGANGRRLETRCCALFAGHYDLTIRPEGPAQLLWCTGRSHGHLGLQGIKTRHAAQERVPMSEQIETLLELGSDMGAGQAGCDWRLRDAIGTAVLSAFRAQAETDGGVSLPACVRMVRDHVEKSFWEPNDLSSLAAVAGVTREHLNATFRRHVGVTPMRFLWDVRRRNAAALVETTSLNLATIAEQCGYKSPFHLSREVKRFTGRSPREIRRACD